MLTALISLWCSTVAYVLSYWRDEPEPCMWCEESETGICEWCDMEYGVGD